MHYQRFRRAAVISAVAALLMCAAYASRAYFKPGTDQVIGSPTRAQVTGTWGGDYGLGLVLRPDGTFTAALPQHVGTAAPVLGVDGTEVLNAWSGHGTWVIGPGVFSGSPQSVIFTVSCGAGPGGCAGHPTTFDLQVETSAPSGEGGPALFYYLDNRHDLSDQYPFVRVP